MPLEQRLELVVERHLFDVRELDPRLREREVAVCQRGRAHRLHSDFGRVLAHLHTVNQGRASADGRGHMDGFRHLIEVGAFL